MNHYLTAREWLEATRLRTDRIADFAAEILDEWIDEADLEEHPEILAARKDADKAEGELEALEDALSESPLAREFITTGHEDTDDEIRKFVEFAENQERQLEAIRDLLVDAGVLKSGDIETDLASVLAMFVG